jgi:uncharacterized protein (TIGR02996 family)
MDHFPELPAEQMRSFLAAIREEPDAEEIRLVFADWLTDHGDPRAELLRLQCEQARLHIGTARWTELDDARRAWLQRYQETWLGPCSQTRDLPLLRMDAGLPQLDLTVEDLQAGLPEGWRRNLEQGWFGRATVGVRGFREAKQLAELWNQVADRAWLQYVDGVKLFTRNRDEETLQPLAGLVHLRRLEALGQEIEARHLHYLQGMKNFRELVLANLSGRGLKTLVRLDVLGELRSLSLHGGLPSPLGGSLVDRDCQYLADVPYLEKLSLAGTSIEGHGLAHLAGCSSLRSLNLRESRLGDNGASALAGLEGLVELDLRHTSVTEAGHEHLAGLTRLERLDLSLTGICDNLKQLAKLPRLRQLKLRQCQIRSPGIADLAALTGLEVLDLSGTRFTTDQGLARLGCLPHLQILDLTGTGVKGHDLQPLQALTALEVLLLPAGMSGKGLQHLAGLESLYRLNLQRTMTVDDHLAPLASLQRQRELNLSRTRVRGLGLAHLRSLPLLQELDLSDTPLDEDGLRIVCSLPRLRRLNLSRTAITDVGLAHLQSLGRLEQLELNNTGISESGLRTIAELPALRRVSLHGLPITTTGLALFPPGVAVEYDPARRPASAEIIQ